MTSVLIDSQRNRISVGRRRVGRDAMWRTALLFVLANIALSSLSGCTESRQLNARLTSPYPAGKVWAVAPFANESGTSAIDTLHVADVFADEVHKVRGIDIVPVSRVLEAMHALDLTYVDSVDDAQTLARVLDVDGLIVGTITSYDPYHPPRLGMTVQLYTRGDRSAFRDDTNAEQDIGSSRGMRLLGSSPTEYSVPGLRVFTQPVASASCMYDASDNAVRQEVEAFAKGRSDPESALGWERFLYSMDQYTEFVCDRLIRDLLHQERLRSSGFDQRRLAMPIERERALLSPPHSNR